MKTALLLFLAIVILIVYRNCRTGYVKKYGDWTWVTIDESHGKRNWPILGIDKGTFKIIDNSDFAKDINQVYYKGRPILNGTPEGFTVLDNKKFGYSRNNKYVFLNNEVIIQADPATFELLEFPYAKDKSDVYCGTIPMKLSLDERESFKVTNSDKLMAGTISESALNYFLEYNPEYEWITDLDLQIEKVITGSWGTGESGRVKFIGYKRVK